MRELLFRGKALSDGKWVEGGIIQGVPHELWQNAGRVFVMVFPRYLSKPNLHEVDHTTVGQYTGLKDKHGKRIFEGDVVEARYSRLDTGSRHIVRWEDASCGFEPFSDSLENCGHCGGGISPEVCVVIGNIHDNPELIGGDNNG